MFAFHQDRRHYFEMQIENAREYLLPFIEEKFPIRPGMRVLEIGCGEAGVLKAFIDRGCSGVGVELDESRLANARAWLREDIENNKIALISGDIYKVNPEKDFKDLFDIIVLKDVIEHIPDQQKLIAWMRSFLKPHSVIFFGFPPWQMPFGGHQQMCRGKLLSKLPYYHLLPTPLYKWLLKKNGEPWEALLEIKETRMPIEKFERLARKCGYRILHRKHFLVNPIYKYKFNIKPRTQLSLLTHVPWLRNFFTTCVYYMIEQKVTAAVGQGTVSTIHSYETVHKSEIQGA